MFIYPLISINTLTYLLSRYGINLQETFKLHLLTAEEALTAAGYSGLDNVGYATNYYKDIFFYRQMCRVAVVSFYLVVDDTGRTLRGVVHIKRTGSVAGCYSGIDGYQGQTLDKP